jgi:hypothetical protein
MNIDSAIRKNSFSIYFRCDNSINCFVVARDSGELSELIDDGRFFTAREIGGKQVQITIGDKMWVLKDSLLSFADAKGFKHWMSPSDNTAQLVNLLPNK